MKLRSLLSEIFDMNTLEKDIQTAENLSKQHSQIVDNIKAQMEDLKKEKLEKEKQDALKAKQEQMKANRQRQEMEKMNSADQNGITTHDISQNT